MSTTCAKHFALILSAFLLLASPAYAQIARDSSADGGVKFSPAANDPLTWTHTTAGSDRVLFVLFTIVSDASGTQDPAGGTRAVTYNSVSMSEVAHSGTGATAFGQAVFLYKLASPTVGANTVSVSTSLSLPTGILALSSSYTGAAGTVDTSATGSQASSTTLTVAVTPSAASEWTIYVVKAASAVSAGSGSSLVLTSNGQGLLDSNGTVPASVPYSMTASAGSGRWDGVIASFAPAGSPPPVTATPSLSLTGVGPGQ